MFGFNNQKFIGNNTMAENPEPSKDEIIKNLQSRIDYLSGVNQQRDFFLNALMAIVEEHEGHIILKMEAMSHQPRKMLYSEVNKNAGIVILSIKEAQEV